MELAVAYKSGFLKGVLEKKALRGRCAVSVACTAVLMIDTLPQSFKQVSSSTRL